MAARRFFLSRRAGADLDSIADYLAKHNRRAARRVLQELGETFLSLAKNPELGNRRDDLHPLIRTFTPSRPASNYIVFYYPRADGVEVSDVIHAARDWPNMFATGER